MSRALLVVWFSLIVADRVDLLAGKGAFLLTPFLVLTPLVVGVELVRLAGRGGTFRTSPRTPRYVLLATVFLALVGVSVMLSRDQEFALKRFALLAAMVYLTLIVAVALANRPDAERILVRGSYLGLTFGLVFNAMQAWAWIARGGDHTFLLGRVIDASPNMYGPWFPRFAGQVIDMNRAGILFLVYVFCIVVLAPASRARTSFLWLGVLLILLSFSRSVIMASLALWAVVAVRDRRLGFSRRGVVVVALVVGAGAGWLLMHIDQVQALLRVAEPITRRFDTGEGSASMHLQLIRRGWDVSTRSPANALIGIGFGNAFHYTQDLFPGDKYGNFHSIYVTLLAESGVVSLCLGLMLLFRPVGFARRWAPLLVALGVFNVFYQLLVEPVFWFVLAAAWTGLCEPAAEVRPVEQSAPPGPVLRSAVA
jgi:hypothetical protein